MTELQRVLCVEDDPDIRSILEFSLRQVGGLEVLMCASGDDALAQLPAFGPQLVLMDVMMPGLSGPQTLQAMRERNWLQGVPVVFLTAKAMRDELESLMTHGVSGIIVKPFDPVRLPQDLRIYWQHGQNAAY